MTSFRASFLCLLLVLSGCAAWHERAGSHPDDDGQPHDEDVSDGVDWGDEDELDPDGDSDPDDGDDEYDGDLDDLEEPDLPECDRAAPSQLPWHIASDVPVDRVALGPCGELAYESAHTLHVLDASFARELLSGSDMWPRFSPDGALFTANGQYNVAIYDLVSEQRSDVAGEGGGFLLQTPDWWHEDVSQQRSVPFVCDSHGLGLFIDGALEMRFPGLGCVEGSLDDWKDIRWGEHGSRVLYLDQADQWHAADFATGLDVPVAVESAGQRDQEWGFDFIQLSDDGRVLVHVAGWDETCGDTFCPMSDGTATVFDLTTQLTHHGVPAALQGDSHEVNIVEGAPGSHRMAIQGPSEMTLLASSDQLVTAQVRDFTPLAVLGRREVLGRQYPDGALELVPFHGGSKTTITPTSESHDPWQPPDVAVSRDGSVIAYSAYRLKRCEADSTLTECPSQTWEVVVWSRKQGELAAHLTANPASPLWVGDDGSVLVDGTLAGQHAGLGWGTFVLDTAGTCSPSTAAVASRSSASATAFCS